MLDMHLTLQNTIHQRSRLLHLARWTINRQSTPLLRMTLRDQKESSRRIKRQ